MKRLILLLFALSAFTIPVFGSEANVQTGTFEGRTWTIVVPDGYTAHQPPSSPAELMTIVFSPEPREDGTRPMVQVSLMSVPGPPPSPEFRAKIAETMIGGVQRRRDEWKVAKSETTINGIDMTRYEWSGISIPAADGARVRVATRGVMLVGFAGSITIALHTQDTAQYADETLPRGEEAMWTFRLTN